MPSPKSPIKSSKAYVLIRDLYRIRGAACHLKYRRFMKRADSVRGVRDSGMLTVKQAAEKLGISRSLVFSLCARKKIRHERHGLGRGTIRIPEDAVDEYRCRVTIGSQHEERPVPRASGKTAVFKHLNAERLRKAWGYQ